MTDYDRNIVQAAEPLPNRTLIRGATILSMDTTIGNLVSGDILIEGGVIAAVGEKLAIKDATIIEASNMIAMRRITPLPNTIAQLICISVIYLPH